MSSGHIKLSITPVFPPDVEDEVDEVDNITELSKLDYLDLEVSIKECSNLPPQYASDVRVKMYFPDFVHTELRRLDDASDDEVVIQLTMSLD